MITSPDNSKLKLVRKLRDRKWREREGLFLTEGEDLLDAGRAAELDPVAVLVAAGTGIAGEQVDERLLAEASALGSGTRVIAIWPIPEGRADGTGAGCVYLHGVSDPGNVGTIVRTTAALSGGEVVLGPGSADAWAPKAVRASMGAIFARPPRRGGVESTPRPRVAFVAHEGDAIEAALEGLDEPPTICLGSERSGLGADVLAACERSATIPVRPGAESLNVAAVAAVALHRISSLAPGGSAGAPS